MFQYSWLISRSRRGISGQLVALPKDCDQLPVSFKCQNQISLVGRQNLLWIFKQKSFGNEQSESLELGLARVPQKLINHFLLFQYSWAYISVKWWNFGAIHSSSGRLWSAFSFIWVSKLDLARRTRKSFVNIQTKEFS